MVDEGGKALWNMHNPGVSSHVQCSFDAKFVIRICTFICCWHNVEEIFWGPRSCRSVSFHMHEFVRLVKLKQSSTFKL